MVMCPNYLLSGMCSKPRHPNLRFEAHRTLIRPMLWNWKCHTGKQIITETRLAKTHRKFSAIFLDRIKASSSLTIAGARTGIRSHGIITSEIFIINTVRVSSASLISISFIPHATTRGSYIHCPAGLRATGALLSSNNVGRIHF